MSPTSMRSAAVRITGPVRRSALSPRFASIVLPAFVAWELLVLLLAASRKPFWYDELATVHVSSLRPLSVLWRALQAGADGMTPTFYGFALLARTLPGNLHVVLRLPSVVGYILALLGVYWFARKRLPHVAALSAVLLLSLSPFRLYAIEARAYALLVGFLAISAALWQRIDEKPWAKPLFVLSLTLAIAVHYLAPVALAGFVMAELTFLWISRRFRWSVWAGFLIAATPFLLSIPWLMSYHKNFGKNFWAQPGPWSNVIVTYGELFSLDNNLSMIGIVLFWLTVAGSFWRLRHNPQRALSISGLQPSELILIGGFLACPALLVAAAKVQNSGYSYRYGWPAIFGLALGCVFLAGKLWKRPESVRVFYALLAVVAFHMYGDARIQFRSYTGPLDDRWSKLAAVSLTVPSIPVVTDWHYVEAEYYSPPELRDRLVRVVDPEIAVRRYGRDAETNDLMINQFYPLQIQNAKTFLAAHKEFILHVPGSEPYDWFPQYLIEKSYHLTALWQDPNQTIFLVRK